MTEPTARELAEARVDAALLDLDSATDAYRDALEALHDVEEES